MPPKRDPSDTRKPKERFQPGHRMGYAIQGKNSQSDAIADGDKALTQVGQDFSSNGPRNEQIAQRICKQPCHDMQRISSAFGSVAKDRVERAVGKAHTGKFRKAKER